MTPSGAFAIIGRLCALPEDAPASGDAGPPTALLGWELFGQLGACVGDAIEACAPDGTRVHVRAWASRKLPPGGIALDRRARSMLSRRAALPARAELTLGALPSQPTRAASVVLVIEGHTRTVLDDALTSYARAWLCGVAIAVGAELPLPWLGRDLWLTVAAAQLDSGEASAAGVPVRVDILTRVRIVSAATVPAPARELPGSAAALATPPDRCGAPTAQMSEPPTVAQSTGDGERQRHSSRAGLPDGAGVEPADPDAATPALDALGGVHADVRRALADLRLSLHRPELFVALGVRPVRGCLVSGPVGSGRTALARALAADAASAGVAGAGGGSVLYASGAQLLAERGPSALDSTIHALLARARAAAPAALVLDELEMVAPPRGASVAGGGGGSASASEAGARAVGALLTALDGVSAGARLVIVATCTRPESVEPALRRPGRLDLELELAPPTSAERLAMLRCMLGRSSAGSAPPSAGAALLGEPLLRALAARSHGYVAADLCALLRELDFLRAEAAEGLDADDDEDAAGATAVGAVADGEAGGGAGGGVGGQSDKHVSAQDGGRADCGAHGDGGALPLSPAEARLLGRALARVPPSALRDAQLEIPTVRWADIGGQEEGIGALREAIEWPLRHAAAFSRLGVRAPRGVLLYGPPGCSKTLTAKALASESGLNFVAVKGPELFSKWVGESEKAVRTLFQKARAAAPSIVFFDEIDALAPSRAGGGSGGGGGGGGGSAVGMRVLAQLLHEMDGVGGTDGAGERAHVIVLGATNRPDLIDAALLRPGRFDRLLYVGLPDEAARLAILRVHTRSTPLGADVRLEEVARKTNGYSGAELAALCREAALGALTEAIDAHEVRARHFEAALETVRPRTPAALLDLYARYQRGIRGPGGSTSAGAIGTRPAPAGWLPPEGGPGGAPAVEAALAQLGQLSLA